MPVITIPLNSGCNEQVDQRLMTDGRLRTLRNGRVDREGRIRVRNGYTAVDARVVNQSGQTMIAYDLATYRGRMVALGDTSDAPLGYPTSLFDWIDGVRPWRRVMPSGQNLPRLTGMREVIGSEGSAALSSHAAAACKDRLLMSYGDSTESVIMVQPSTGRVLFIDDADEGSGRIGRALKMVETDAKIIVVGQNDATASARFLYGWSLDETSRFMADGDIATALIDAGVGNTIPDWAIARVGGSEHFVIVAELSTGAVVTRLFTAAGVVVVPSGGQFADITANPTDLAIEADATSNTVNVAMTVGGQVRLFTFNLTTGAEVGTGPHVSVNMGAATASATGLHMVRESATSVIVVANITDSVADKVGLESYNTATNAFGTSTTTYLEDAVIHAQPAYHDGEVVLAVHHDTTDQRKGPVLVLSVTLSAAANDVTILSSVDLDLWGAAQGRIFQDTVTGKWYWDRLYSIGTVNDRNRMAVTEFELDSPARRQMAEAGNMLYLSGGLPLVYDGVACVEMSFADHPRIIDTVASNGAGALDTESTYTYGYHYQDTDARGNVVFSSVADPEEVTTAAGQDTVTLTLSRPYSLRCSLSSGLWRGSVYAPAFRNTVDDVDGNPTPSALLQWIRNSTTAESTDPQGDPDSEVDERSDDTVVEQVVIYTQARTILDNRPPRPCFLMAFDGTRMMTNSTRPEHWRASKPLQTEEQVTFPREGVLAFQGSTPSDIEAIVPYAQSWLIITRRDMWVLNGQGPNIDGAGEFQSSYRIPSDGGMRSGGWVSVCVFGKGALFQLEDDQLYLWSGGAPQPVGLEIQDTLEEFPNVVAACHISRQQAIALALQNDAGTDGCIAIWDQQSGFWYRDDVGVVTSLCEHDGKLAFIKAGVVYLEDEDYGLGTAVPITLSTGNVAKTGAAGASGIQLIHLVGVFQDECTAEMRIKYTDEATFTSLGIQTLNTAAGYGAGRPFDIEWCPPRDDGSRYELELVVTSSAEDTKLAWLNAIEVHYDVDDGPTRVGDARRR